MNKINKGDEVIVGGEIMYVEKKAKKKWYKPFSKDNYWHCYNGYGEDVLVKETKIVSIGAGSLSWSCWLNADSVANTRGIVRIELSSSSGNARYDGLQILLVTSKISGYLIDYNNSGNDFVIQSSSNLVVGKWHHAVVSLDANAETLELFVDGVSEGSVSLSSIGAREIADGNFTADEFNGRITDIRLYDSALTLTEVLAIYNGTTDRTNLTGQWLTNSDDVLDHAGTLI